MEVGTWRDMRGQIVTSLIDNGPGTSGVYARFTATGQALELLDPRGGTVRTLRAGAGLVAASAQGSFEPTWVITGTDAAGVSAAAEALTPARLAEHFALAVQGASSYPVPLEPAR